MSPGCSRQFLSLSKCRVTRVWLGLVRSAFTRLSLYTELLQELGGMPTPEAGFYNKGNPETGPWFWHADEDDIKLLVENYPKWEGESDGIRCHLILSWQRISPFKRGINMAPPSQRSQSQKAQAIGSFWIEVRLDNAHDHHYIERSVRH